MTNDKGDQMKAWIVVAAMLISGCTAMMPQPDVQSATTAASQAAAANPNGSIVCTQVIGPWGTGKVVVVSLDKGTQPKGALAVDDACKVTMTGKP